MADEFDMTPHLTLDPSDDAASKVEIPDAPAVAPADAPMPQALDESSLSDEERKMVNEFAQKIELTSSSVIMQYGSGAQKKIADFSETALGNVRSKDLGEVGEMLAGVVSELKSFDEDETKGFFRLFQTRRKQDKRTQGKIQQGRGKH